VLLSTTEQARCGLAGWGRPLHVCWAAHHSLWREGRGCFRARVWRDLLRQKRSIRGEVVQRCRRHGAHLRKKRCPRVHACTSTAAHRQNSANPKLLEIDAERGLTAFAHGLGQLLTVIKVPDSCASGAWEGDGRAGSVSIHTVDNEVEGAGPRS
jgi:hypothetical protein